MTEAQKLIIEAADLLGGLRALSRVLVISERTARAWAAGDRNPGAGVWADLAKALEVHGRNCNSLAARVSDLASRP